MLLIPQVPYLNLLVLHKFLSSIHSHFFKVPVKRFLKRHKIMRINKKRESTKAATFANDEADGRTRTDLVQPYGSSRNSWKPAHLDRQSPNGSRTDSTSFLWEAEQGCNQRHWVKTCSRTSELLPDQHPPSPLLVLQLFFAPDVSLPQQNKTDGLFWRGSNGECLE